MNFLIERIQHRLLVQNKNWLAIICGETGSGKSYSALKLAELIDSNFAIDRVVFSAEEFMTLLNSGKLHRGNAVVWDEAGTGKSMAVREWYSLSNKMINYTLQSFRRENLALMFTVPSFGFLDSQTRRLFHCFIETQFINYKNGFVKTKWFDLQLNPRMDKLYFRYPVRTNYSAPDPRDWEITIDHVNFYKPSATLIEAYEQKKQQFVLELKHEAEREIKKQKHKERMSFVDLEDIETKIRSSPALFVKEYNKRRYLDLGLIMSTFGIGERRAKRVKHKLEGELCAHNAPQA